MCRTALIVDDSETMRQMVAFTLRQADFEVTEAENGADALQKLQGLTPHLIISDVNMPVMDGLTFVKNARGLTAARYVPILMLTTEYSQDMKTRGKEAGATGWVVKPFNPEKLLSVVSRVLP